MKKLDQLWHAALADSDPAQQYRNNYFYRRHNGQFETQALDAALDAFATAAFSHWVEHTNTLKRDMLFAAHANNPLLNATVAKLANRLRKQQAERLMRVEIGAEISQWNDIRLSICCDAALLRLQHPTNVATQRHLLVTQLLNEYNTIIRSHGFRMTVQWQCFPRFTKYPQEIADSGDAATNIRHLTTQIVGLNPKIQFHVQPVLLKLFLLCSETFRVDLSWLDAGTKKAITELSRPYRERVASAIFADLKASLSWCDDPNTWFYWLAPRNIKTIAQKIYNYCDENQEAPDLLDLDHMLQEVRGTFHGFVAMAQQALFLDCINHTWQRLNMLRLCCDKTCQPSEQNDQLQLFKACQRLESQIAQKLELSKENIIVTISNLGQQPVYQVCVTAAQELALPNTMLTAYENDDREFRYLGTFETFEAICESFHITDWVELRIKQAQQKPVDEEVAVYQCLLSENQESNPEHKATVTRAIATRISALSCTHQISLLHAIQTNGIPLRHLNTDTVSWDYADLYKLYANYYSAATNQQLDLPAKASQRLKLAHAKAYIRHFTALEDSANICRFIENLTRQNTFDAKHHAILLKIAKNHILHLINDAGEITYNSTTQELKKMIAQFMAQSRTQYALFNGYVTIPGALFGTRSTDVLNINIIRSSDAKFRLENEEGALTALEIGLAASRRTGNMTQHKSAIDKAIECIKYLRDTHVIIWIAIEALAIVESNVGFWVLLMVAPSIVAGVSYASVVGAIAIGELPALCMGRILDVATLEILKDSPFIFNACRKFGTAALGAYCLGLSVAPIFACVIIGYLISDMFI
ncbi:MAG TPA: hypothetical protein VHD33_06400, partial [Legionellaceae bacterium]|nr:hypothetical protein [Legionellaceae bacterium]